MEHMEYCGVFDSRENSIYKHLSHYDVLLFPTRWKTEGVPGILVEAKFAGLAAIVSDTSFNSIIVKDGEDGLVIKDDSVQALSDAIDTLQNDENLLIKMKKNAQKNASYYSIETYIDLIVNLLNGVN